MIILGSFFTQVGVSVLSVPGLLVFNVLCI